MRIINAMLHFPKQLDRDGNNGKNDSHLMPCPIDYEIKLYSLKQHDTTMLKCVPVRIVLSLLQGDSEP